MNRTATRRRPTAPAPKFDNGERVADRLGATGVVVARVSRTQSLVSYDDGRELTMYNVSLRITQN